MLDTQQGVSLHQFSPYEMCYMRYLVYGNCYRYTKACTKNVFTTYNILQEPKHFDELLNQSLNNIFPCTVAKAHTLKCIYFMQWWIVKLIQLLQKIMHWLNQFYDVPLWVIVLYYCFTAFSHISSITIFADIAILRRYLTSH